MDDLCTCVGEDVCRSSRRGPRSCEARGSRALMRGGAYKGRDRTGCERVEKSLLALRAPFRKSPRETARLFRQDSCVEPGGRDSLRQFLGEPDLRTRWVPASGDGASSTHPSLISWTAVRIAAPGRAAPPSTTASGARGDREEDHVPRTRARGPRPRLGTAWNRPTAGRSTKPKT